MPSVKFSNDQQPENHDIENERCFPGLPRFPNCSYRFIPDLVAWFFGVYGYVLGRWPWPFLTIGILTALAAASGLWQIQLATDSNNLIDQFLEVHNRYVSDDATVARWLNESTNLYRESPRVKRQVMTDNDFCDSYSSSTTWRVQNVMVIAKGNNIFNEQVLEEILDLTKQLRDLLSCSQDDSIPFNDRIYCCDSWDLQRLQAELSKGGSGTSLSEKEIAVFFSTLTYPADKRFPMSPALFASFFGGVKTSDHDNAYDAKIVGVKAMLFQYLLLPYSTRSAYSEQRLTAKLKTLRKNYKSFDIYWQTWRQLEDEFTSGVFTEAPKIAATFICVILWCTAGAIHTDALNSKPWLALLGIGCTAFACLAGFGAEFWLGEKFYTYLVAIPLMSLGIGLDDMFILLSNWQRSGINLPREQRAMLTLQEGGTSIFVTALMTIIDFIIGTYTPYPAINTYSNFALWCLSFDFWLQMTVFMSVLVLSDGCEKKNRHSCCCCLKIRRRSRKGITKKSVFTVICCTHGSVKCDKSATAETTVQINTTPQELPAEPIYENVPRIEVSASPAAYAEVKESTPKTDAETKPVVAMKAELQEEKPTAAEKFIYDVIAPIILHPISRILIAIGLVTFLAASLVAIWTQIQIGFRPEHLANRLSNTYDYNVYSWQYFRDYSASQQLEIVLNFTTAPYNRNFTRIRKQVVDIAERLEQSNSFIWDRRLNHVPIRDIQLENVADLDLDDAIHAVAQRERAVAYKPALVGDNLHAERLICLATFQTRSISTLRRGAMFAQFVKNIQATYENGDEFHLIATDQEQALRVFDQITNLPKQLVYFSLITLGSTVVVAFLMIPHPICVFWLALSAGCIIIGTVAGMVLWGVSLDPVSLIYVLMAIGATADYICHSIYTFTIIKPVPDDLDNKKYDLTQWSRLRYGKARRLITYVVCESVPALIGTLLSIVALSTTNIYVLEAFFKVFLLSVVVAFVFMTIVLPVALCQFGPAGKACCPGGEEEKQWDIADLKVEVEPASPEGKKDSVGGEQRAPKSAMTTDMGFTNSAIMASVAESHRPLATSPSAAHYEEITNHRSRISSSRLRNDTWKTEVLTKFLKDSKKYMMDKSTRSPSQPAIDARFDDEESNSYVNAAAVLRKANKHKRAQSVPHLLKPSANSAKQQQHDSSRERQVTTKSRLTDFNDRRTQPPIDVQQATHRSTHNSTTSLQQSAKQIHEENLRRHGVRRGVLNH